MSASSISPEIVVATAVEIRDVWRATRPEAIGDLLASAHADVLRWLAICASTPPELKFAIRQEEDRRIYVAATPPRRSV